MIRSIGVGGTGYDYRGETFSKSKAICCSGVGYSQMSLRDIHARFKMT